MSDLRYAFRQWWKRPGFTAVMILSLAVGIGVNHAVFSLLNAVSLRSLPVKEPSRLRVLNWSGPMPKQYAIAGDEAIFFSNSGSAFGEFSYPLFSVFREQAKDLGEVFAFSPTDRLTAVSPSGATSAEGLLVSGNFFSAYGASSWMGRSITMTDDRTEALPAAMITYRWWERHFGMNRDVLGQTLTLNHLPFTIIGVLPRDFAGPLAGDAADIYIPLAWQAKFRPDYSLLSRNDYWLQIMARLPAGGSETLLQTALETLFLQHQHDLLESPTDAPKLLLKEGRRGPWVQRSAMAYPLRGLAQIAALVLLVACLNVAGLLLARNAARQHEMAVRTALGADRWNLVRPVLAESALLALAGAGVGWLLAWWGQQILMHLLPAFESHHHFNPHIDATVLGFTVGITAMTALLVGLLPALVSSRSQPAAGLRKHSSFNSPRLQVGKLLVIAQVAAAMALVACAGLMARTLFNLGRVPLGFNAERLLVFQVNAAQADYSATEWSDLFDRLREAIAVVPGVSGAAFSDQSHLGAGFGTGHGIKLPGREEERLSACGVLVCDEFLATLQIPLLLGRGFNRGDTPASGRVAVVNQVFAEKMFPGETPLGKSFKIDRNHIEIVGICGNAQLYNMRADIPPIAYLSYRQSPAREAWFGVRTAPEPRALAATMRQVVARLDPSLAVTGLSTQKILIHRLIAEERMFATFGGGLALLAAMLSCLGIYGLLAYQVARRTTETGIRMALGAGRGEVARRVMTESLCLVVAGVVLSIPLTLAMSRIIRSLLYGVGMLDPMTLGGTMVVFLGVAALGAWIPARRAARVDPMVALKCE